MMPGQWDLSKPTSHENGLSQPPSKPFRYRPQVTLNSAALAIDDSGQAARVTATGSNRLKLKKGSGTLRAVRLKADGPGKYALRAASASRKVAVRDALLAVVVS